MFNLGKVLKTALSLYCELNQPFPSMDEVVICTSETTTEDVSYINYFVDIKVYSVLPH